MPPKRKRDEEASTATSTSTRKTSARIKAAKDSSEEKLVKKAKAEPKAAAAKSVKAKPATAKTNVASRTTKNEILILSDEFPRTCQYLSFCASLFRRGMPWARVFFCCSDPQRTIYSDVEDISKPELKPKPSKASAKSRGSKTSNNSTTTITKYDKIEPYSPQRSTALFSNYADSDQPDVISLDGLQKLCAEADIPMDGALPLILAWQLDCKEMGKITKDEWCKGCENLLIASLPALRIALTDLEDLLVHGKSCLSSSAAKKSSKADTEPYNRAAFKSYIANTNVALQKLHSFCFLLAKPEASRNIDMETATALWSVLLAPRYPIVEDVIIFISEKKTYKAVNKDLWSMMLEFCETVKPDLTGYDADGAWPTLIDDFVQWKEAKITNQSDINI